MAGAKELVTASPDLLGSMVQAFAEVLMSVTATVHLVVEIPHVRTGIEGIS